MATKTPGTTGLEVRSVGGADGDGERRMLSGNEAIARGAWEAGVLVGAGYPGTPSTEILEALARLPGVDCEWSPNEKVALEVAVGAGIAGGRSIATMKHVGVNVAADPLFSVAYMGVNGGLVIVSADDPGMHSSQNEQDNRLFARAARLPLLEPATPDEARSFAAAAFDLSERYDTPVLLRSTTRLSHGKGRVTLGERREVPRKPYRKDRVKNVVLPAHGRIRHRIIEERRMPALAAEAEGWTETFDGDGPLAIITAGPPFLYVREAFPDAPVLKLGMSYPLPADAIRAFAAAHDRVLVVEELDPFLEEQIRSMGLVLEPRRTPRYGELSVEALRAAYGGPGPGQGESAVGGPRSAVGEDAAQPALPGRPPVLCPGCSHRGTFYALHQLDAIVSGDIGCYTLGALPPLDAMDTCMNMGASIGMAHGMEKVMPEDERRRLVSVIGDSTFYHSGITGLVDIVYNGGASTVIVLDNHTTAMTGHQEHPGTGGTLMNEPARVVDIEMVARGIGVEHVERMDPYDLEATRRAIDDAMRRDEPSLLIADAACVLAERIELGDVVSIDYDRCTDCMACTLVGCPAIEEVGRHPGHLEINEILCTGCTHCQQVCADCNAGIDVPQVLDLLDQGRHRDAFDVLVRANPFPAIAGRVCPHPCDHEVNALRWPQARLRAERHPGLLQRFEDPKKPGTISVRDVERFLGDWGREHVDGADYGPDVEIDRHVAVVGSGPAGLSAAWFLRRRGYGVTVLEALDEPGGMLRYGIPAFRLDRDVLDAEIRRLTDIGVEIRTGAGPGADTSFEELEAEYDAVVLAVGAWAPRPAGIEGEEGDAVLRGVDFLRRYNAGEAFELGQRVGIIGGGNTAIDCARVARRTGADVTLYYRRTESEMPAIRDEIEDAVEEGVELRFQTAPTEAVVDDDGRFRGVVLVDMEQGEADESGRRRPVPIPGSEHEEPMDTVILAIGETADLGFLEGTDIRRNGRIDVAFTGATSRPGVFAAGDGAFGHGTVTQAVATGARAAAAAAAYLRKQ